MEKKNSGVQDNVKWNKKLLFAIATAVIQDFGLTSLIKIKGRRYRTSLKLLVLLKLYQTGTSKAGKNILVVVHQTSYSLAKHSMIELYMV